MNFNLSKNLIYFQEKLGNDGILLYPSMNSAPHHYAIYLRPFHFGYTAVFNVFKLPTCHVPMGLDDKGIPVGIQVFNVFSQLKIFTQITGFVIVNVDLQVVAGPDNDKLCIAVAKELESAFGGWVPPS